MRKVAVVQARMGNTRCPGKNGALILGKPQIWYVLERVQRAGCYDDVLLAIPHESNGGVQIDAARSLGIETLDYRGNCHDLVHRYAVAADIMDADIVVRIPGDNTFVDADEIRRIVSHYDEDPAPWNWLTTNLDRDVLGNGYPAGLGAEVYDVRFLQWLDKTLTDKRLREHPHRWAFENQHVRTIQAPDDIIRPWLSLSVDTEEQLAFTREAYAALYPGNPHFNARDLFKYMDEIGATYGK
jgi:spore coat polysaccharide biosynthesis protein SpsF